METRVGFESGQGTYVSLYHYSYCFFNCRINDSIETFFHYREGQSQTQVTDLENSLDIITDS